MGKLDKKLGWSKAKVFVNLGENASDISLGVGKIKYFLASENFQKVPNRYYSKKIQK